MCSSRAEAQAWIDKREKFLKALPHLGRLTVAEAITLYEEQFGGIGGWGRTKRTTLDYLRRTIGDWDAAAITSEQLVRHAVARRNDGASAATVQNDFTWLRVTFKALRAIGRDVALQAVDDAMLSCRAQRLIGRPKARERRPTADELDRLRDFFIRKSNESQVPMVDLVDFAIASTRRESEITRLLRSDNDAEALTGMVRDAKHPTQKEGNDRRFKYTREAWEIQARQPASGDLIFPFNPKTIGQYFRNACKLLEIPDLRFHDLRHEGTSRLFEAGYSIAEVMQFTLHEDVKVLMRYTHLRPEDVELRS
ncbi:MAG: tyrosine-type recombinase/integrase [Pseudomonadota bacterium]